MDGALRRNPCVMPETTSPPTETPSSPPGGTRLLPFCEFTVSAEVARREYYGWVPQYNKLIVYVQLTTNCS